MFFVLLIVSFGVSLVQSQDQWFLLVKEGHIAVMWAYINFAIYILQIVIEALFIWKAIVSTAPKFN